MSPGSDGVSPVGQPEPTCTGRCLFRSSDGPPQAPTAERSTPREAGSLARVSAPVIRPPPAHAHDHAGNHRNPTRPAIILALGLALSHCTDSDPDNEADAGSADAAGPTGPVVGSTHSSSTGHDTTTNADTAVLTGDSVESADTELDTGEGETDTGAEAGEGTAETGDDEEESSTGADPDRELEVCQARCMQTPRCGEDAAEDCPQRCLAQFEAAEARAGLSCRIGTGVVRECLSQLDCEQLALHSKSEPDPVANYPCEAQLVEAMMRCGDWEDQWLECEDGSFVSQLEFCDGNLDCPDGIDESLAANCFICGDGSAIPHSATCNGFPECPNELDESLQAGCRHFFCNDGGQIPESQRCDGIPDCSDGSDEVDCP